MIRVLIFCLLSVFNSAIFAAGEIASEATELNINTTVTLRDHGYTLGDMIDMHIEFSLDKKYTFDPNSLPLKGPVTAWLDLRHVSLQKEIMDNDSELIKIDFKWQLFATVVEAQIINLPDIFLRTLPIEMVGEDEYQPLIIKIPSQGVYLSPVLPEKLTDEETPRPIIPPPRFDTETPMKSGVLWLVLAVSLMAYWLYLKDKISCLPRNPGAMTLLARQLRKQGVAKQSTLTMTDLRTVHAALATCAGNSLYPNTLNNLFENAPYLESEKENITQFFDDSWQLFHQQNTTVNLVIAKEDTLTWIHRAALAERVFVQ